MLINKNGKIYFLKQSNELISDHVTRSWFIVNNLNVKDPTELEKLSKMWIAIEKYNCIYPPEYMEAIQELKKNYQL